MVKFFISLPAFFLVFLSEPIALPSFVTSFLNLRWLPRLRRGLIGIMGISLLSAGSYALPSFPGAEGFGGLATGGRGGKIVKVTNLNDNGAGSFREALYMKEPRIIVFEIGGIIDVQTRIELPIGAHDVTIAGQTAPGGISLSGGGLVSQNDNFILRHMRFRGVHNTGSGSSTGTRPIMFYGEAKNVMVDHISASWGCDQNINAYPTKNLTYQWTFSTEANLDGNPVDGCSHGEGGHNYGSVFAAPGLRNISLHHILWMHNSERNPLLGLQGYDTAGSFCQAEVLNTVIYNCGIGMQIEGQVRLNLIGNYFEVGPNNKNYPSFVTGGFGDNQLYYEGDQNHIVEKQYDDPWDTNLGSYRIFWMYLPSYFIRKTQPFVFADSFPKVTVYDAVKNKDSIMAYAGAFPRDSLDRRNIMELKTKTGSYGKKVTPLDHPLMGTPAPMDSDNDGMPDMWEDANGLDKNTADDTGDHDGDGYTNIEEYINDLAGILINKPTANPTGGVESVYNPNYSGSVKAIPKFPGGFKNRGIQITAKPNPFRNHVNIEIGNIFRTDAINRVPTKISIFNINGKRIYQSDLGGRSKFTWRGTNQSGKMVPKLCHPSGC